MEIIWPIIIIFSAFGGFLLSFYIHHKKRAKEQMSCPLDFDCDAVIYSEYSKFLGFPLEILGLLYYGLIAISYALFLIFPTFSTPFAVFSILVITTAAFLFSLYLTFIQAFSIKQWCAWCLMSAGLCVIILSSALLVSKFGFISLLSQYHYPILFLHFLGAALGIGGATIADILFFRFLKDFRISEWEADVMRALSQIIWFALAILILSGIGLYLPQSATLNQSASFLLKMVIVGIIIINGAFLNLLITPKLVQISFGKKHDHESGELHHIRKLAFAFGAISIVSWYSVFILATLRPSFGFGIMLIAYGLLLGGAVIMSQVFEWYFVKRANLK